MYTPTNAYLRKFSSGLLLATLLLSGIFSILVIAAPAGATTQAPAAFTNNLTAVGVDSGTYYNLFSVNVTNPSTNPYAIDTVVFHFPTSVTGTSVSDEATYMEDTAGLINTCVASGQSVTCSLNSPYLTPGSTDKFSDTGSGGYWLVFAYGAFSSLPATASMTTSTRDTTGIFTSGNSVSYRVYDTSSLSVVTDTSVAAGNVVAGSSLVVTAEVTYQPPTATSPIPYPGLPIFFHVCDTGFCDSAATDTGASLSSATGTTNSTGMAKTTLTVGPCANGNLACTVAPQTVSVAWNIGGGTYLAFNADNIGDSYSGTFTSVAGTPSQVAFAINSHASNYITAEGTTTTTTLAYPSGFTGAKVATTGIVISVADRFGNPILFSATATMTINSITLSALSGSGLFDTTGLPSSVSCSTNAACKGAPWGAGSYPSGNSPYNYYQGANYATVGQLSATIGGTYNSATFTVAGNSGTITTGTFATTSPVPDVTYNGVLNASPTHVPAGGSVVVSATIGILSTCGAGAAACPEQKGVPINMTIDLATSGKLAVGDGLYAGTFSGSAMSVTLTTNSSGQVQASFAVDTFKNAFVYFQGIATSPAYGLPSQTLTASGDSVEVVTDAGSASSFAIKTYFYSDLSGSSSKTVPSGTLYLNVVLVDAYGNVVTLASNANTIQVNLAASAGLLSATSVYITATHSDTKSSFGTVIFTAPSSTGTLTITASGVVSGNAVSGTKTITVVSKSPTLFVNSPAAVSGVIYAGSTPVVFGGNASVSTGYPTIGVSADTIAEVCYTFGTHSGCTAQTTTPVTWSQSLQLLSGMNTVSFNATDANGNTVSSGSLSVLVDTAAPDINFVTVDNANISSPATVSANVVDKLGDLNASSVSATATNVDTSATKTLTATVTGTNTPGSSVTYGVTLSGLTVGNWSIALSAADLAGNTNSSTITVHVTVQFGESFAVVGTPSLGTLGGYSGINVVYQNLNPTSQSVVIFAVWKNSAGQTVGIGAGSATVAPGAQTSAFIVEPIGLASGSYTVNLFVWTTGNLPVSITTTITVST